MRRSEKKASDSPDFGHLEERLKRYRGHHMAMQYCTTKYTLESAQ
jgi:hypothetical protein